MIINCVALSVIPQNSSEAKLMHEHSELRQLVAEATKATLFHVFY